MMKMKSPCISLDGVFCTSEYHRLCPRAICSYWRQAWLRRVDLATILSGHTSAHFPPSRILSCPKSAPGYPTPGHVDVPQRILKSNPLKNNHLEAATPRPPGR